MRFFDEEVSVVHQFNIHAYAVAHGRRLKAASSQLVVFFCS